MHEKKFDQPQPGIRRRRGFAGREAFAEGISRPRIGEFELQGVLGKGGMSTVYLATDRLGREVALKTAGKRLEGDEYRHLDDWFVRECAANLMLSHPNIIHAFEAGETRSHLYLSMERLDGKTLHAQLSGKQAMGWDASRRLYIQIADALAEMERAGVVHRDLKPENVFLAKGPGGLSIRILDFGLCHVIDYEDVYSHIRGGRKAVPDVTPGSCEFGTPEFRPPEFDLGESYWLPSFDIYSAGLILFNMAAGDLPFPQPNIENPAERTEYYAAVHQCMAFQTPREVNPLAQIPPSAEGAIMACLDKDPSGRPKAAELKAVFESC